MINFNKYSTFTPNCYSTKFAIKETTSYNQSKNSKKKNRNKISTTKLTKENKQFLKFIGLLK